MRLLTPLLTLVASWDSAWAFLLHWDSAWAFLLQSLHAIYSRNVLFLCGGGMPPFGYACPPSVCRRYLMTFFLVFFVYRVFYALFFGFCFCLLYVNYTYITLFCFNNLYICVYVTLPFFCLLYVNYTYITLFWFNNLCIYVPFLCVCNIVSFFFGFLFFVVVSVCVV